MRKIIDLSNINGFEWDDTNKHKNKTKHNVTTSECEEVFYNKILTTYDNTHSQIEERYTAYGVTNTGRQLYIVFTIRKEKIRIISARNQDKKERSIYAKYTKST